MDIQTSLIYGGIVIACAVVLFAISMFGIKEKTYDEAIAEQRLIPNEHLLLGRSSKDKSKEKKVKKTAAGKKVKEKPAAEQDKNHQKDAGPEVPTTHHEKSHVEFEPDAEVITSEHPHQEEKKKKKKMKPILMNKEEHNVVVAGAPVLVNHFEESLPKDDLLLKRRMSMENLGYAKSVLPAKGKPDKMSVPKAEKPVVVESAGGSKADTKPEKVTAKSEKAVATKAVAQKVDKAVAPKVEKAAAPKADKAVAPKVEKAVAPKVEKVVVVEEVVVAKAAELEEATPFPMPAAAATAAKDQRPQGSRKKKSELAALQQMTGDREGVNVSLIVPLVQKAELSRSEIQILIDLLLNKQQNSAEFNSEWIEGRQDPMVKLKKQLAEKEKALADEQEAAQAVQSKLRELRAELNTDRSRWRQLEEAVGAKQLELQHAATRLQHAQEAHKADKANMLQQVQQLQAKVGEDHVVIRKLQEEQGQAQGAMQQEIHGQRQQLELHVAHLVEQHTEADKAFTQQMNQLHAQLLEEKNVHGAVRKELQLMRDNAIAWDAENKKLRENISQLSNELQRQESQANDLVRQVEEQRRINEVLDHRINSCGRTESQLQYEKDQLLKELEATKEAFSKVSDVKSEFVRLQTERDNLLQTVQGLQTERENHLQTVKGLQTERDSHLQMVKGLQSEAQHAREEKERLDAKVNGLAQDTQRLRLENETLAARVTAAADGRENGDMHHLDNEKKKEESLQMDILMKQKESEVADLTSQIINYKTEISRLSNECEAQREKNNELRTRNWKAMEALSATEKSLETQQKETKTLVNETSACVRLEEQTATRQLLERLFPDVTVAAAAGATHAAWLAQFEPSALLRMSAPPAADAADVAELEGQVAQLQGMVAKYKTIIAETEGLLKRLQQGAEETEADLEAVRGQRDQLERTLEEVLGAQEEKDRLLSELAAAQERDREMTKELTKLKCLAEASQDGRDSQHPVDKLNGVTEHHTVATNGSETGSSNAEGGSGKK